MKFCSWNPYTEVLASSPSAGQYMINRESIINIATFNYNHIGFFFIVEGEKCVFLEDNS